MLPNSLHCLMFRLSLLCLVIYVPVFEKYVLARAELIEKAHWYWMYMSFFRLCLDLLCSLVM